MRKTLLALMAASIAVPATFAAPIDSAQARREWRGDRDYRDSAYDRGDRDYRGREWRGRDGRTYCRKSDGTTGLLIGGVGGALLGRTIDTRGERTTGTLLGAAAGALAGKAIDSKRTCR